MNFNIVVYVFIWAVPSFLSHYFGKEFLQNEGEHVEFKCLILAVILTAVQLFTCLILTRFSTSLDTVSTKEQVVILLTHSAATLLTNGSMSVLFAASTFAVKLTEPLTTAIAQIFYLREQTSIGTLLSLPVIVIGALVFTADDVNILAISLGGMLAFLSNIVLATRNTAIKITQYNNENISLQPRIRWITVLGLYATCIVFVFILERNGMIPSGSTRLCSYLLLSAVFHVLYSYISTAVVLNKLSVVSHAVGNIIKRLSVVLLLYSTGTRTASSLNFVGLAICMFGLSVYSWSKMTDEFRSGVIPSMNKVRCITGHWRSVILMAVFVLSVVAILKGVDEIYKQSSSDETLRVNSSPGNNSNVQLKVSNIVKLSNTMKLNKIEKSGTLNYTQMLVLLQSHFNVSEELVYELPEYNSNVDRRSPLYSNNTDVINEAQRIHMKLFKHILGRYNFAILLDLATFENKGDPAITVGELHLLRKLKIHVIFHCKALESGNLTFAKNLSTLYTNKELVILLHGGGNIIGYPQNDHFRSKVIELFPNFELILFPQSIWLRLPEEHIRFCQKIYSSHPRLTFIYRDERSFIIGKQLFPRVRAFLAPDMAFQIGFVPRFMPPTYDILWLRRSDHESTNYTVPRHIGNYTMHVGDWWKWLTPKGTGTMEDPFLITTNGMMFLQRGRIVISDRLHGHILSTLLGIPQILIDPLNRKISSYVDTWTKGLANVILTNSSDTAVSTAVELLKKLEKDLPEIVGYHNSIEFPTEYQKINFKKLRTN